MRTRTEKPRLRLERKWRVLLLISVGSFMSFLDAPVLSVAFPAIEKSFPGTAPTTLAWTLDAYFIGFAAFLVVGGRVADRYGRRNLFMGGLLLFTLASLACALSSSVGLLIAARAVQALAAAVVVPAGQGLMLAEFPPAERRTAIGALAALVSLATAFAPAVGGVIIDALSWRWIFWVNVIVTLLALLWGARLLVSDAVGTMRGKVPDLLGAALQGVALGLIVLGILKSPDWGVGSTRAVALFAVGLLLLALFIWRCAHHPTPVLDLSLFANRTFAVANLSGIALGIGFYAGSINSVLFFTHVWGWSILAAGVAFVPGGMASALAGKAAGELTERHGARVVGAAGAITAGAGVLLIALSTSQHADYVADFLPGQLLYGVGMVAGLTALLGAVMTSAPPSQFAVASGISNSLRQVGGAIGVAAVVAVSGNAVGAQGVSRGHTGWIIAGLSLVLAGAMTLLMRSPRQDAQSQPVIADVETTTMARGRPASGGRDRVNRVAGSPATMSQRSKGEHRNHQ